VERSASFNAPVGHADLDLVGDFMLSMSPGEEEVGKSVIEDRIPGKGFQVDSTICGKSNTRPGS
jgi:hypothetical protein